MIQTVIKRDGSQVDFDKNKIREAIQKASVAAGFSESDKINKATDKIVSYLNIFFDDEKAPHVEEIQDLVEKVLIEEGMAEIAKKYILYREQKNKIRNTEKLFSDGVDAVNKYIDKLDWKVKENSNTGYSLQGLNQYLIREVTGEYWKQEIYPREITKAHEDGDLHLHDLSNLSVYCCGWDLEDILLHGFCGVQKKIESDPPRHFRTALGQIINFFYTLQGEAAGAQALSNFDTYLAPFIAYDDLNYNQIKQHIQEFLFNINVPTRVGWQVPFTNVTLDLKVPEFMQNQPVIIGGERQDRIYQEFQHEMDMFNKAFAEMMMEGDSKGRMFSFPIPTYNITPNFDWDNPVLKPVWEMTAKYGIPYFANFVNSDMEPEDVRSMCCRLRIQNTELRKRGGGLFGANPMTGSIGVVTLNMPRLGYLSDSKKDFMHRLYELMDIAKESLLIKRKVIEGLADKGLYPYTQFYLRSVKDRFDEYYTNHFNTIGISGLNEACLNLMGKNIADPESIDFAKEVMNNMRDKLTDYQEDTDKMFNLEATPAESTSYRLAKLDQQKYGKDIICANHKAVKEGAEPYYTNSSQLPVGYTNDIFTALELQDDLQTLYTGGTVVHGFLGERVSDTETTKKLVRGIAENFELPYYSLTPTFSICPVHGYLAGEHQYCPKCEKEA